jgi:hypothetical protein
MQPRDPRSLGDWPRASWQRATFRGILSRHHSLPVYVSQEKRLHDNVIGYSIGLMTASWAGLYEAAERGAC